MIKRALLAIIGTIMVCATSALAQNHATYHYVQSNWMTLDNTTIEEIDYTRLNMPSLDTLFTSARFKNPQILRAMKTKEFQEQLVKKERKYWLSFFSGRANYNYGVNDNYVTTSSVYSPAYQVYNGGTQAYWSVGGNFSMSLEDLFDLKGRVKRQQLQADMAGLDAENQFNDIKREIITLYVAITNTLAKLKFTSEIAADYQGSGLVMRERFLNDKADITEVAGARRDEVNIRQNYQSLLQQMSTNLLILEVITGYPIISRTDVPLWGDGFDWSKFDLSKWLPEWFKERDLPKLRQYYRSRALRFVDQVDSHEYISKIINIMFTNHPNYYKLVFIAADGSEQNVRLSVEELLTLSLQPTQWVYYDNYKFEKNCKPNNGKLWIQGSTSTNKVNNK